MSFVMYLLCVGVGYVAGNYLPDTPLSPYIPLLVSYHLFVIYLIAHVGVTGDQKIGLSMSIPVAFISHLAFVGAMIGMVMGRRYVPLFGLIQYAVPSLAPFEVQWIFEGAKKGKDSDEPARMPEGTMEDYAEFVEYMKNRNRKYEKAGQSIHEEYEVWAKARSKRRAKQPAVQ